MVNIEEIKDNIKDEEKILLEDACHCMSHVSKRTILDLGYEFKDFIYIDKGEESKIGDILIDIIKYMSNRFTLTKDNIIISRYKRNGNFNGLIFIFNDIQRDILGNIFIIPFSRNAIIYYYYKFDTSIDPFPATSVSEYKAECRKFYKFLKEIGLKHVTDLNFFGLRLSICRQPVLYTENGDIMLDNFKEFVNKIEEIGQKYVLQGISLNTQF